MPPVPVAPRPLEAALWMLLSSVCIGSIGGLIREAAASGLPILTVVFFRNIFGLLLLLPIVLRHGPGPLGTGRLGLYGIRAGFDFVGMTLWFTSFTLLPLAQVIALTFTMPLWATVGAALLLGEVVRLRRWAATLTGFAGVLVITVPGFASFGWTVVLPVISSAGAAGAMLSVKALSSTEPPERVVFYMLLMLTPLTGLVVVAVELLGPAVLPLLGLDPFAAWGWPDLRTLGILVLIGLVGNSGHYTMTRAFRLADASYVMPFTYAQLPFAAAIGWVFFGQGVGPETWIGAVIIAAATGYIAHRERQLARRPVRPGAPL